MYDIENKIPGGNILTINILGFELDPNLCTSVFTLVHETDDTIVLDVVNPASTSVINNILKFTNVQTTTSFIHKFRIKAALTPVIGYMPTTTYKFSHVQQITLCSSYVNIVQALTLTDPLVFSSLDGATNFQVLVDNGLSSESPYCYSNLEVWSDQAKSVVHPELVKSSGFQSVEASPTNMYVAREY